MITNFTYTQNLSWDSNIYLEWDSTDFEWDIYRSVNYEAPQYVTTVNSIFYFSEAMSQSWYIVNYTLYERNYYGTVTTGYIYIFDSPLYLKIGGYVKNYIDGWIKIDGVIKNIKSINFKAVDSVFENVSKLNPTISRNDTLSPLYYGVSYLAATSIGSYTLFGGGTTTGSPTGATNAITTYQYGSNRSIAYLSSARAYLAATNIGNYALFAGGTNGTNSNVVDAFNNSLYRTTPTPLSAVRNTLSATSTWNCAYFGGGYTTTYSSVVDVYNASLVKQTVSNLDVARSNLAATTVGNYALFGGGRGSVNYSTVDAYGDTRVKESLTGLSASRGYLAATTVGNYALFGGGNGGSYSSVVDCYDNQLVRTVITPLSTARDGLTATSVENYAIFAGGKNGSGNSDVIDIYDKTLVKYYSAPNLSYARQLLVGASRENRVYFAGGYPNMSYLDFYEITPLAPE